MSHLWLICYYRAIINLMMCSHLGQPDGRTTRKDEASLSYRVAMCRKCLMRAKTRSTRCRFLSRFVEFPLNAAVAPGSDDGLSIRGVQIDEDGIAVTGFVGANRAGLQITQEWQCFGVVACLTADYVESIDQPPGIRAIYDALRLRLDVHEAEHVILECLGETLWRSQRDGKPMDAAYYLESLRRNSALR